MVATDIAAAAGRRILTEWSCLLPLLLPPRFDTDRNPQPLLTMEGLDVNVSATTELKCYSHPGMALGRVALTVFFPQN